MAYTNVNKSSDHFNVVKWTGTSSSPVNVTGFGHNPDMIWNKYANGAGDHQLYDAVRGATKMMVPNNTNGESTNANGVTAFITDGFTAGSDINVNGGISIAHGWKLNGQGSANTDGSINTLYTSANTTSGVSVSTWNGTGSNGTIGHGLNKIPKMLIIKRTDGTQGWMVYHAEKGNNSEGQIATGAFSGSSTAWQTTDPTSSVFYVSGSTGDSVNASGYSYVGYAFAEVTGFSRFGTYATNNNQTDGPYIYCGFKPSFIMAKNASASGYNWVMWNDALNPTNQPQFFHHHPNTNDTWVDNTNNIDILSNGFKLKDYTTETNGSGDTIIYAAFAAAPLVGSNNVPCTAR